MPSVLREGAVRRKSTSSVNGATFFRTTPPEMFFA